MEEREKGENLNIKGVVFFFDRGEGGRYTEVPAYFVLSSPLLCGWKGVSCR